LAASALRALGVLEQRAGGGGFSCDRGLPLAEFLPHRNDDKGEQHRIDHADDREDEAGDLVVEDEPIDAHPAPDENLESDRDGRRDDDHRKDEFPERELRQRMGHCDLAPPVTLTSAKRWRSPAYFIRGGARAIQEPICSIPARLRFETPPPAGLSQERSFLCALNVEFAIGELRAKRAEDVLDAAQNAATVGAVRGPILDGYVLPASALELLEKGRQNDVPLLPGSNADEGTLFANRVQPEPTPASFSFASLCD